MGVGRLVRGNKFHFVAGNVFTRPAQLHKITMAEDSGGDGAELARRIMPVAHQLAFDPVSAIALNQIHLHMERAFAKNAFAGAGVKKNTVAKSFRIKISGGVGIGTNNPNEALEVVGNILASGTITGSSDRNVKENFTAVDSQAVLAKVAMLPIQRWNYIGEVTPHIGPVAQDFYGAFAVGKDDRHISMVDADGVALAAIQGLNEKVDAGSQKSEDRSRKLEEKLQQKATEIAELKQRFDALEKIIRHQQSNQQE